MVNATGWRSSESRDRAHRVSCRYLPGHEWTDGAGDRGRPLGIQSVDDDLEGHRVIGDIRVGAEVQRADALDDNVLSPGLIDERVSPRKYSVVEPGGDDGVLNARDGHSISVEFPKEHRIL